MFLTCLLVVASVVSTALADPPMASADPVETLASRLAGAFSDGSRTLRLAKVPCDDFDVCLYVEMAEKGGELRPLRQQVWGLRRTGAKGAEAVVFAFPKRTFASFMPSLADLAIGMWAAPERFPRLDLDRLDPIGAAPFIASDDAVTLKSEEPFLIHRAGAEAQSLSVVFDESSVHWLDELRDGAGGTLSTLDARLKRIAEPTKIRVTPEGLVVIDLRVGPGVELAAGDSALVEFGVRLFNGQLVDSTRLPGRKSLLLQPAPGNLFEGFRQGVLGMRALEKAPSDGRTHLRRLIVPPALAFGARGRGPIIGPDEKLVVDIELVTLRDNTKD